MRVLYFHQHFTPPTLGGGIRSYEFAQRLIARGHSVTMVCGGETAKFHLASTQTKGIFRGNIDGIDVIQIALPYSNHDGVMKRAFTFVRFAWRGIQFALKEPYDLLFATSTPLTAGIPGIIAKLFRHKPFVFEVRDLWPELPKALGLKNPFLLWGMKVLEWLSYHFSDACIGLAPGICEGIMRCSQNGKKIEMIPNGCDLDLFKPENRSRLMLDGIKATDKVALFAGAHGIANGLDAVLDVAFELKRRKRDDIVFLFVGEGKMKQSLMERVKNEELNNCCFLSHISPKNGLDKLMASVDVGMMILANIPAFYYGTSPNKFFDYISSGLPVLNNYPGWLADMIQENHCGVVVPPNNPEIFAQKLTELLDDSERCKEYGINARKLAEQEFNRVKLGDKFVDFLESVVKK